ncbi:MAG TPA: arsenite methyltransferase [Mycobacteriales bacterium]|jgi:SAM-dependent methyltransferase|nr:arsenite methyltransferase [Mycobacteriales bacterium]
MTTSDQELREQVRERYAAAARAVADKSTAGCCGPTSCTTDNSDFAGSGYDDKARDELPADAVAASLGCGNPTAVAELREGETVLDLGSGGGIDVILSARRVGATGKAYGVDMTDEMLELSRRNAADAGIGNVEFLKGHIEAVPLPDASIDVVISNCVVNLSTDKPAVFAEMARLLRPGGRIGVADIVADDTLSPAERAERGSYTGCIAGALSVSEFEAGLRDAGFTDVTITVTHDVADRMHSAIIRATKPTPAAASCG